MRKPKCELTEAEQEAVRWGKAYYPHCWRKKFSETREQFMTRRPEDWPEESWGYLYLNPFGFGMLNRNVQVLRRLLAEGKI